MEKVHSIPALPTGVSTGATRPGWLEDWRLAALLVAVTVVGLAAWTVVAIGDHRAGRQRRHSIRRRLGRGAPATLGLIIGVGLGVNAYVGYAPDVASLIRSVPALVGAPTPGSAPATDGLPTVAGEKGRVTWLALADHANRIPTGRDYVYLPPGYDNPRNATRRYPVVYLIHGYPGGSYDWIGAGRAPVTAGLLQNSGLAGPIIIVSPEATAGTLRDTECLDSTGGGPRLETFLTSTVVSAVDRTFRTLPYRASRAIGGMSSGGYCALNLGLRHQAEFGVVIGIIPYGAPGRGAVNHMLGGSDGLGREASPSWYASTIPLRYPQALYLSSGREDPSTSAVAEYLARVLAGRGDFVGLRIDPRLGHTWRTARAELPFGLAFAAAHLSWSPPTRTPPRPAPDRPRPPALATSRR